MGFFILPSSGHLGHAKSCYAHGFKNRYGERTGFGPGSWFYLVLTGFIQVLGILPDRIGAWFLVELVSPVRFLKQRFCLCWSLGKEPLDPLDSRKCGVPFFPSMHDCSVSKKAWVSDLIVSNSEGGRSWNLLFCHGPHDW